MRSLPSRSRWQSSISLRQICDVGTRPDGAAGAPIGAYFEHAFEAIRSAANPPNDFVASLGIAIASLEADDPTLVKQYRSSITGYGKVAAATLKSEFDVALAAVPSSDVETLLRERAKELRTRASLVDSTAFTRRSGEVSTQLDRLLDSQLMSQGRARVHSKLTTLKGADLVRRAIRETNTGSITAKSTQITRQYVTTLVKQQFAAEVENFRLNRLTLEDSGGRKGNLMHRPSFESATQSPRIEAVLSEGEQTALGLAGFFVDAHFDSSNSAIVLDDPISSLDHINRGRVAKRLAKFARDRQVVVFTHDASFVIDLSRAADELGVRLAPRSVERRGDEISGISSESHPWKVRDVGSRFNELKQSLVRINNNSAVWSSDKTEAEISEWAGKLSETWERIIRLEVVGRVVDQSDMEVRPSMFRILACISDQDNQQFQSSYRRVSAWARRHDKAPQRDFVAPASDELAAELELVNDWWRRIRRYAG